MMLHSISTAMKNLVLAQQKEDCTESQQKQQQSSSPSAGSSKYASEQQEEAEISSHSQMLGGMPLPIRQTGEKKAVCSMEGCVVIPQSAVLGMAASQEAALAQAQSLPDPQKTESLQSMPALGQDETEESPKEQVILGTSEQLLQLSHQRWHTLFLSVIKKIISLSPADDSRANHPPATAQRWPARDPCHHNRGFALPSHAHHGLPGTGRRM